MIDKLLKKHAKNYVMQNENRPFLEGIHYHENGSIYVTNSHTILAIHNAHEGEKRTVHYKTGKVLGVRYPEVSRIIPQDSRGSVKLSMQHLKKYLGIIKVASSINETADLKIVNGELVLISRDPYSDHQFKMTLGEGIHPEFERLSLNILYFHHMLDFFKDAGVDEIIFSWTSHMRPLLFEAENYQIIILPVRRY